MSVVRISKHSPFHGAASQDHGRLVVVPTSKHPPKNLLYTRVGLLGPYCKKKGELAVGTSTPADACAFQANHSSSHRRPEKLAHMFRLLGLCFEPGENREKRCTHVRLLGPRVSKHF